MKLNRTGTLAWTALIGSALCSPNFAQVENGKAWVQAPLPMGSGFVENLGQWPSHWSHVGQVGGVRVLVDAGGLVLMAGRGAEKTLQPLRFVTNPEPAVGYVELLTKHNFLSGNDPDKWVSGARTFQQVRFGDLQVELGDGVWSIARTAIPTLQLRLPGAMGFRAEGSFWNIATERGWLYLPAPKGVEVRSAAAFAPDVGYGVELELAVPTGIGGATQATPKSGTGFDPVHGTPGKDLQITWATWLGGSNHTEVRDLVLDDLDQPIAVGHTEADDFPVWNPLMGPQGTPDWTLKSEWDPDYGLRDGFVSKLTEDGSQLLFSTYVSGSDFEELESIAIGPDGSLYIAGGTTSENFPVTPGAYDTEFGEPHTKYIGIRLEPDGSAPIYSGFLSEQAFWTFYREIQVVVDDQGRATYCASGPMHQTPGTFLSGAGQTQMVRLSADGSELLFGCAGWGQVKDLALLSDGRAVMVTQCTGHSGPPLSTPGAAQPVHTEPWTQLDLWIAVYSNSGELDAATYWGGSISDDYARALAIGENDDIYFTASSFSDEYPVLDELVELEGSIEANEDSSYLVRMDKQLTFVKESTAIATTTFKAFNLVLDSSGVATAFAHGTGITSPGAHGDYAGSSLSMHVGRYDPQVSRLLHGSNYSYAAAGESWGMALSSDGRRIVVGGFSGATFGIKFMGGCSTMEICPGIYATPGAFQTEFPNPYQPGSWEYAHPPYKIGFVTKFEMLPEGIAPLGSSGQSCRGPIHCGATRRAEAGVDDFGLYCSGGPASAPGLLGIGAAGSQPLPLLGLEIWIDPAMPTLALPVATDEQGFYIGDFSIPANSQGALFAVQFFWIQPAGCNPEGAIVTSHGLNVEIY